MKDLRKIITIGPIYPYRGGIAHSAGLFLRHLQKRFDAQMVSYKLMYPQILYPGGDQKDWENDFLKNDRVSYLLNTVNPISYFKTASYIKKEKPDMVIFHWWHPFFAPAYYVILKLLGKKTIKCISCNNVMPHDRFPFATFLTKLIYRQADAFMIYSKKEKEQFELLMGNNKKVYLGFCPDINNVKPEDENITKTEAREKLGISVDEKVILFFGFVRKYKGLHHLLNAMGLCKGNRNIKLLIAGDFYDKKEEYLHQITELDIEDQVKIFDGYISDQEIPIYFSACDLVALPYESATTSGVIQMAYHYDKPVIATDVGEFPDVVVEGKTGYIVTNGDDAGLADAIIKMFEDNQHILMVDNVSVIKEKYSWDSIVDGVEQLWGMLDVK